MRPEWPSAETPFGTRGATIATRNQLGTSQQVAYNGARHGSHLDAIWLAMVLGTEASPSLVYGARLLSGFRVDPRSCVRIALPPPSGSLLIGYRLSDGRPRRRTNRGDLRVAPPALVAQRIEH